MTIRTLEDFLKVPAEDLGLCLKSFREKIELTKMARADAKRLGMSTVEPLDGFEWSPNAASDPAHKSLTFEASSPLAEMGLRPSAVRHLKDLQIYCLEDCTEASEGELLRIPDIGRSTVLKLREYLIKIGLDFKQDSNPVTAKHDRARALRLQPLQNRKGTITDESEIAQLGLKTATFKRCLKSGLDTVGKLRRLNPRDDFGSFGTSSWLQIAQALETIGLTLNWTPSQLELWRYGMREKSDLCAPEDDESVIELQPWLGAAVFAFHKGGVSTVGELRALVRSGSGRVRGIGKSTAQRVADFCAIK